MRENKEWAYLYACLFLVSFIASCIFIVSAMVVRNHYLLQYALNTPSQDHSGKVEDALKSMHKSYGSLFLIGWLLISFSLITLVFFTISIASTNKEEDYEIQKLNLDLSRVRKKQEIKNRKDRNRLLRRKSKLNKIKGYDSNEL